MRRSDAQCEYNVASSCTGNCNSNCLSSVSRKSWPDRGKRNPSNTFRIFRLQFVFDSFRFIVQTEEIRVSGIRKSEFNNLCVQRNVSVREKDRREWNIKSTRNFKGFLTDVDRRENDLRFFRSAISRREAKLKIGLGRCIRYSIDVLLALGQARLRIIRNGTRCWECCFSNRLTVALSVSNKYTRVINKLSR